MNSLKDIIKRHFPHLDSGTISVEDKKFVVVSAHKKPKFSNEWPRERPKHLTFHLCKEGMDTVHIFGQLARELGMNSSHVFTNSVTMNLPKTFTKFSFVLICSKWIFQYE